VKPLKLAIANKNYSSWSMRPWVLLTQAGIAFEEIQLKFSDAGKVEGIEPYSPTRQVPVLIVDGEPVWDSLAICEAVAELFPDKNLWPADARARQIARSICAEMHTGFRNLRGAMPVNIRASLPGKGMSPAVLDVIGGQVQVLFASVPGIVKQKPDLLRPIAMAEMKRSALLPDLPTINESGLPGFAVANWAGLLGPAGLDPKIVKKLHDEVIAIIATAEMKERIKTLGYDLIESSPEEFAKELKSDIERWGPVAKRAGVSVN